MKRNSMWVAALVVAIAGAVAGGATAFGGDVPKPETAAEYYSADMSLGEISAASEGKSGEVVPPCPDAAVVTELKASGLPVGPCDPLPEDGSPIILEEETADDNGGAADDACAFAFIRTTTDGPNKVEGPCGAGALIVDAQPFVDARGTDCATVTYVAGAGSRAATSTVCAGDPADPALPRLVTEVE